MESEEGDSYSRDPGEAWPNERVDDPVLESDETTEGWVNKKRKKHWHDDVEENGISADG